MSASPAFFGHSVPKHFPTQRLLLLAQVVRNEIADKHIVQRTRRKITCFNSNVAQIDILPRVFGIFDTMHLQGEETLGRPVVNKMGNGHSIYPRAHGIANSLNSEMVPLA